MNNGTGNLSERRAERRRAVLVVAVWASAAVVLWVPAPRIPALLADDATSFLPDDYPSRRAAAMLHREFSGETYRSQAAIVVSRSDAPLTPNDLAYIASISDSLSGAGGQHSWRVRSATLDPWLTSILTSRDGRHAVIAIDLPADMLTQSTVNRVRAIQETLRGTVAPAGLLVDVTGGAALAELLDGTIKRDVDRTTFWAFVAVGVILVLVYRSPSAVLLPIATIAISLMVTLGALGFAAEFGFPINGLVEMFLIVVVAGCGVDYCLFLFARFREEAERGASPEDALRTALTRSRGAILASGATNVVGLAALALGANRDLYTSGPTIAASLIVVTLAVVTLTPAMMRLAGRRLLWSVDPGALRAAGERRWARIARLATRRPGRVVLFILAVLAPWVVVGRSVEPAYDPLEEFPADSSFVRGARRYAQGFYAVPNVSDVTLLVQLHSPVNGSSNDALRRALSDSVAGLKEKLPILYVRHLYDPLGSDVSSALSSIGTRAAGLFGGDDASAPVRTYFVGESGRAVRLDMGLALDARSRDAMRSLGVAKSIVGGAFARHGLAPEHGAPSDLVTAVGESASYDDIRALQRRDFRVVAIAASVAIGAILVVLLRSVWHAMMLIGATLLAYAAAYGATWVVCRQAWGLPGISYQIDFLLFIVMLSLGQDYNIYVVARIREELRRRPPRRAVEFAVRKTGQVVSSCGLIMTAAFGSLYAGSLSVQKQFAVALSLGILLDTFVIRPLLVPAALLAMGRLRGRRAAFASDRLRREIAERAAPRGLRPGGEQSEKALTSAPPE